MRLIIGVIGLFAEYARRRYDPGFDSAGALVQELRPLGCRGSDQAVGRYLRHLRRIPPRDLAPAPSPTTA